MIFLMIFLIDVQEDQHHQSEQGRGGNMQGVNNSSSMVENEITIRKNSEGGNTLDQCDEGSTPNLEDPGKIDVNTSNGEREAEKV
eukprot:CAMPEP_0194148734 /NCGR_PEP_ID=MMETSP0152-20130528/34177_1 /TAXON_ID=1049557 /ORGANISM="Thalassiothrix antarctica, Strain L6-D1" /LENGTH=84 /DNA_ID=CAMNT_0038850441 /DNA_START=11 /DNA_END=265 /DNA_ORIENTATION=-